MDTSTVVIVLVVVFLVALALYRMTDVEAVLKVPLVTFSLKARDRRDRKRDAKSTEQSGASGPVR